jgi:hypothetical protein
MMYSRDCENGAQEMGRSRAQLAVATGEGGFHGDDFGGGGNREVEFRGRGLRSLARGRGFDHRGEVGDPYWTPCNYDSYGTDSCE